MTSQVTRQDSDKLKGIVLRTDGDFTIYVWSPNYPLNELRFIDEELQYNPGDFISFKLTAPLEHIQTYDSIKKVRVPRTLAVVDRNPAPIKIIVQVGFPPRDSNYFDKDLADTLDYGVIFYCYCPEFGKLVSFDYLNFEPGHFYTAHIERIPLQNDWSIKKLGTMFVLIDHPLTMIENEEDIRRLTSQMPWKRLTSPPLPLKEETSYGATVRALLDNVNRQTNDNILPIKMKENNCQVETEYPPRRWPPENSSFKHNLQRKNDFGDEENILYTTTHFGSNKASTSKNLFSETINGISSVTTYGENEINQKKEQLSMQNLAVLLPTISEEKSINFQDRQIRHLERNSSFGTFNQTDNSSFKFSCDTSDYHPGEIFVKIEEEKLVITGEHKREDKQQSFHRSFTRRVLLPQTVKKETIECNVDSKGHLNVVAELIKPKEEQKIIKIPVKFVEDKLIENGKIKEVTNNLAEEKIK